MLVPSRFAFAFLALSALSIIACGFSEKAEAQVSPKPVTMNTPGPKPVLVELFTSQGCSSCPPADAVLQALAEETEKGEAEVIALSYHVDYWNRLGWRDPYSQAAFSDRQRIYARHINDRGVYTPQLVINGQSGHIGSRQREVRAAIAEANLLPVEIEAAATWSKQENTIRIDYKLSELRDQATLQLALISTAVDNEVPRGENRGRHLSHTNVVRELIPIEQTDTEGSYSIDLPAELHGNSDLAIVLFVQNTRNMEVLGTSALVVPSLASGDAR